MPRCGRIRNCVNEIAVSPTIEKIMFIPPFLVLIVEIILIRHAILIEEAYVIILTVILLILSVIEIILVFGEIHKHYKQNNFDRILTIRLDDFILESKKKNIKEIIDKFLEKNPKYEKNRDDVYHITCEIMETHKMEKRQKEIYILLKKYIKRRKKMSVDDALSSFLKKKPKYRKFRDEIYQMICQIKGETKK
jgi:hypothetical protein